MGTVWGTHTIYEEYVFPAEVMIAIDLWIAMDRMPILAHPGKPALMTHVAPPDRIRFIFNQKAKDPRVEPLSRHFK